MPDFRVYTAHLDEAGSPGDFVIIRDCATPEECRSRIDHWRKHPKRFGKRHIYCFETYLAHMPANPDPAACKARARELLTICSGMGQGGDVYIIDGDLYDGGDSEDPAMPEGNSKLTAKGKPKTELAQSWFAQFEGDSIQAQAARQRLADAARTATHAAVGSSPNRPEVEKVQQPPPQPCQHYQCKHGTYEPKPEPPSARYAYMQSRKANKRS